LRLAEPDVPLLVALDELVLLSLPMLFDLPFMVPRV
jgi:hypothetical protein